MIDGLARFTYMTYVSDGNELNKIMFREFHAKSYSHHPRYQKTLTTVKKFYY